MESTRNQLISLLEKNKEDYISGQTLSAQLGISRTAVWKHMKELEKDGYTIEAFPRRGYRIVQFPQQLSVNTLQWGLQTKWLGKKIVHQRQVASTQVIGHKLAMDGAESGTVIVADEQTKGKGRMDRTWHSAKDKGIWMSIILRPAILPQKAPQITLLTATVLADVINEAAGIRPAIKWPNDLLLNGRKISGVLTEMQAEQDQIQYIVLGIGINVNQLREELPADIKDQATSLKAETGQDWNLIELIQQLLLRLEEAYEAFLVAGFAGVKHKWESYGYKLGEAAEIHTAQKQWKAVLAGIENDGALRVRNPDGSYQKLYSAEIKW